MYLLFINCAKISIPFCLKEKDVGQYDKNKLCIILILSGFFHLSYFGGTDIQLVVSLRV